MNIFFLSEDPKLSAQYLCNQHVVKMSLESCQMISTYMSIKHPDIVNTALMKPSYVNHPCNLWLLEEEKNIVWLLSHLSGLLTECQYRGFKVNRRFEAILWCVTQQMTSLAYDDTVEPVLCMPDEFKVHATPVKCYRAYYQHKALTFKRPMKYTNRCQPKWLTLPL